jgi:hypothetical protein
MWIINIYKPGDLRRIALIYIVGYDIKGTFELNFFFVNSDFRFIITVFHVLEIITTAWSPGPLTSNKYFYLSIRRIGSMIFSLHSWFSQKHVCISLITIVHLILAIFYYSVEFFMGVMLSYDIIFIQVFCVLKYLFVIKFILPFGCFFPFIGKYLKNNFNIRN